MPSPWEKVLESPQFQALPPDEKQLTRDTFFNQYIAPQAEGDEDVLNQVRNVFNSRYDFMPKPQPEQDPGAMAAFLKSAKHEAGAGILGGVGAALGGIAAGALTGAEAGSIVPGWGTLAGAVIGGIGGGFLGKKTQQAIQGQEAYEKEAQELQKLQQTHQVAVPMGALLPTLPTMMLAPGAGAATKIAGIGDEIANVAAAKIAQANPSFTGEAIESAVKVLRTMKPQQALEYAKTLGVGDEAAQLIQNAATSTGQRLASQALESGAQMGIMSAGESAAQVAEGNKSWSDVPGDVLRGTTTGLLPGIMHAPKLGSGRLAAGLSGALIKGPVDAALMATGEEAYDAATGRSEGFSFQRAGERALGMLPSFSLLAGGMGVFHGAPELKKPTEVKVTQGPFVNLPEVSAPEVIPEHEAIQNYLRAKESGNPDELARATDELNKARKAEAPQPTPLEKAAAQTEQAGSSPVLTEALKKVSSNLDAQKAAEMDRQLSQMEDEGLLADVISEEREKALQRQQAEEAKQREEQYQKLKDQKNAIQEPSASGLLQYSQEGAGETGRERERVEPSEQGLAPTEETNGELRQEEIIDEPESIANNNVGVVNTQTQGDTTFPQDDRSSTPISKIEAEKRWKEIRERWGSRQYGRAWKPKTPLEIRQEAESLMAILNPSQGFRKMNFQETPSTQEASLSSGVKKAKYKEDEITWAKGVVAAAEAGVPSAIASEKSARRILDSIPAETIPPPSEGQVEVGAGERFPETQREDRPAVVEEKLTPEVAESTGEIIPSPLVQKLESEIDRASKLEPTKANRAYLQNISSPEVREAIGKFASSGDENDLASLKPGTRNQVIKWASESGMETFRERAEQIRREQEKRATIKSADRNSLRSIAKEVAKIDKPVKVKPEKEAESKPSEKGSVTFTDKDVDKLAGQLAKDLASDELPEDYEPLRPSIAGGEEKIPAEAKASNDLIAARGNLEEAQKAFNEAHQPIPIAEATPERIDSILAARSETAKNLREAKEKLKYEAVKDLTKHLPWEQRSREMEGIADVDTLNEHKQAVKDAAAQRKPVSAEAAKEYGIKLDSDYEVDRFGIARPSLDKRIQPFKEYSARGERTGEEVSAEQVKEAVKTLPKTVQKILKKSGFNIITREEASKMEGVTPEFAAKAEGFYHDGKIYVIPENIVVTTADANALKAAARVLVHENLHEAFDTVIAKDPKAMEEWKGLLKQIPENDLEALARDYQKGDDWRRDPKAVTDLAEEWLAKKWEDYQAGKMAEAEKPIFERILNSIRKIIERVFGGVRQFKTQDEDLEAFFDKLSKNRLRVKGGDGEVGGKLKPSYAGEESLKNMDEEKRSMMKDSLETAKAMAAAGKSSEEIRAVTGWFPGKYDGKMRYEVPDYNAKLKKGWEGAATLGDVIDHPELFSVYPQAKNINIHALIADRAKHPAINGHFDPRINSIAMGAPSKRQLISGLLHEVQHWVQEKEGFAEGQSEIGMSNAIKEADRIPNTPEARKFWGDAKVNAAVKLRKVVSPFDEKRAYKLYLRAAGEIESRDIQARQNFTDEQRKATAPYSSENIAPEDAIVMFGRGIKPSLPADEVAEKERLEKMPVTPEMNAKYMEAVKNGDMETAQRMVDEVARAAGFNVGPVYHETRGDFNEFLVSPRGAIFFAFSPERAKAGAKAGAADGFGRGTGRTIRAFIKADAIEGVSLSAREKETFYKLPQKILTMDDLRGLKKQYPQDSDWIRGAYDSGGNKLPKPPVSDLTEVVKTGRGLIWGKSIPDFSGIGDEAARHQRLRDEGYDAGLLADEAGISLVVLNPSQIKSADPVTYDNQGNPISLSERFNPESKDIRFSIPSSAEAERERQFGKNLFGISMEAMRQQAAELDLPPLDRAKLNLSKDEFDLVKDQMFGNPEKGLMPTDPDMGKRATDRILSGEGGLATQTEEIAIALESARLTKQLTALDDRLGEPGISRADSESILNQIDDIKTQINRSMQALYESGTKLSRAFYARQMFFNNKYELQSIYRRARRAKGGKELTKEEHDHIFNQAQRILKDTEAFDKLEAEKDKLRIPDLIDLIARQVEQLKAKGQNIGDEGAAVLRETPPTPGLKGFDLAYESLAEIQRKSVDELDSLFSRINAVKEAIKNRGVKREGGIKASLAADDFSHLSDAELLKLEDELTSQLGKAINKTKSTLGLETKSKEPKTILDEAKAKIAQLQAEPKKAREKTPLNKLINEYHQTRMGVDEFVAKGKELGLDDVTASTLYRALNERYGKHVSELPDSAFNNLLKQFVSDGARDIDVIADKISNYLEESGYGDIPPEVVMARLTGYGKKAAAPEEGLPQEIRAIKSEMRDRLRADDAEVEASKKQPKEKTIFDEAEAKVAALKAEPKPKRERTPLEKLIEEHRNLRMGVDEFVKRGMELGLDEPSASTLYREFNIKHGGYIDELPDSVYGRLLRKFVEEGERDTNEIAKKISKWLGDNGYGEISKQDVLDRLGKASKRTFPDESEIGKRIREIKAEIRDKKSNNLPEKTPEQQYSDAKESLIRSLEQRRAELSQGPDGTKEFMRLGDIINSVYDVTPDKWSKDLEAKLKKELRNAPEDERDLLQDMLDAVDPKLKLDAKEQAIQSALEKRLKRLEAIRDTAQENRQKAEVEYPPYFKDMVDAIDEIKKSKEKGIRERQLQKALTKADDAIAAHEQNLSPEVKPKRFESLDEEFFQKEKKLLKDKRYTRLLQAQERKWNEKLEKGDFAPKKREERVLNEKQKEIKARIDQTKENIDKAIKDLEWKQLTPLEKAAEYAVRWKRFAILSSPISVGKLTSAASTKAGTMSIENFMRTPLDIFFPQVSAELRKVGVLESRATAKQIGDAMAEGMSKGMTDAWETLKKGQSELDKLYGKGNLEKEGWTNFFGRFHSMLKAPIKRTAFKLAMSRQIQAFIGEKGRPPSLDEQIPMGFRAYEWANRQIFMNDNAATSAWNSMLSTLEHKDMKTAAALFRFLLPIVKVPTNIAIETLQYTPLGFSKGLYDLGKLVNAGRISLKERNELPEKANKMMDIVRAGLETIKDKPQIAESILRNFSKGTIGTGLLMLGAAMPQIAGGFYEKGEKRHEDEPDFGEMMIGGVKIPKWALHAPFFEVIQLGSTFRRAVDESLKKHGEREYSEGAIAGLKGVADELPFIAEMARVSDAFDNQKSRNRFLGDLAASSVIPAFSGYLARKSDTEAPESASLLEKLNAPTVKRETVGNTLGETIKKSMQAQVPGLREQLLPRVDNPFGPGVKVPKQLQEYEKAGHPMPSVSTRTDFEKGYGKVSDARWLSYVSNRGRGIRQAMAEKYPELMQMNEEEKRRAIQQITKHASSEARKAIGLSA